MKIITPPLKSQGIKTKLVPWIMSVAPKVTGRWIEPFMGTGVVGFNSGYKNAILSDTNPHIINFYQSIQDGSITPERVKSYLIQEGGKLRAAENDGYAYYLEVRNRFNTGGFSPYDFLFLSRAGFNGMMRFGGKGNWNIPFCKKPNRFSQAYVTKIVNQVSAVRSAMQGYPDWSFVSSSFPEIISTATKDDIIYCDPPYFGRHTDYFNKWTQEDEEQLFYLLSRTKAKFVLSTWHHNDWRENEAIGKYKTRFNVVTIEHFYHNGGSIANRRPVVEALVCNFDTSVGDRKEQKKRPKPCLIGYNSIA